MRRHLAPSFTAMASVLLIGVSAALALGAPATTAAVGVVMLVPTALVLACCAGLSATNDPYRYILTPQLGYVQSAAPIVIAIVAAGGPVLVAREAARHGASALSAAFSTEVVMLLIGVTMAWWLGKRMGEQSAVAP